jgi:hypothetical protein
MAGKALKGVSKMTAFRSTGGSVVAVLVALIIASVLPTSANAGAIEVDCTSVSFVVGTPVPPGDNHISLVGDGWCTVYPGDTVNGNIAVAEKARLSVRGTVNGNVQADTEHEFPRGAIESPFNPGNSIRILSTGTINGNVSQSGSGNVHLGGTLNGNAELTGTGVLNVGVLNTVVNGNVSFSGFGCLLVFSFDGWTTTINGNVESDSGGLVFREPFTNTIAFPECVALALQPPFPLGGPITIDGNVCGLIIDPEGMGGIIVEGHVKQSC